MTALQLAQLKREARALWAAGDYDAFAEHIWEVGPRAVARAGVSAGEDVLDIACGTGNAAIPAALAGARVVGLDLTPELFAAARRRAAAAGAAGIEWVEGDAEALPFADASFDVVLSVFGVMWAPRHEVAAREAARVLRPGGRMVLTSWTLEGTIGDMLRTIGAHLPEGPDFASPPPLWGSEEHVAALFEGTGLRPSFARERASFAFASRDAALAFFETKVGGVVQLRAALEPHGAWPRARADLEAWLERVDDGRDGGAGFAAEYLVVTATSAR